MAVDMGLSYIDIAGVVVSKADLSLTLVSTSSSGLPSEKMPLCLCTYGMKDSMSQMSDVMLAWGACLQGETDSRSPLQTLRNNIHPLPTGKPCAYLRTTSYLKVTHIYFSQNITFPFVGKITEP